MESDYLTVPEILRILRMKDARAVTKLIHNGELPAIKPGHAWLIPRSAFAAWLERNTVKVSVSA